MLDRRLNAFRSDLADIRLKGRVEAERFVEGEPASVAVPVAALRPHPDFRASIDTQLLFGETLTVFDRRDEWAFVQSDIDGYVGYLPEEEISDAMEDATHWVAVPRTFVYPGPDLRFPHAGELSMGSRVAIVGEEETRGTRYALMEGGGAVAAAHLLPVGTAAGDDYVAIAARFLETPYLWGGRSGFGIDCSGLVQLAMMMAGASAPRDSDMQAAGLGQPVGREALRRGDLVFWKGHVGIMEDGETLLHANGLTMTVARENLDAAVERIGRLYDAPTGYRRPR
ncbi:NlpC/P60 family protein [Rhizobiaceae bacterium BDR2-2]|uniref:NlpC/P60 family protein n=1 Tax=Ectorhizobium quercum TaxID=2965071 RepID=A0AAE3MWI6_9HYPH|nr:NlpC/P60 family protein [Ectorhizobium quercum]MCX8995696.1 NlpC/P60 family protein [Ectorhizobium quercum]